MLIYFFGLQKTFGVLCWKAQRPLSLMKQKLYTKKTQQAATAATNSQDATKQQLLRNRWRRGPLDCAQRFPPQTSLENPPTNSRNMKGHRDASRKPVKWHLTILKFREQNCEHSWTSPKSWASLGHPSNTQIMAPWPPSTWNHGLCNWMPGSLLAFAALAGL